ncbi:MAG TPA: helix-hairpin-helix domain-containing protein [Candidatus Omnitrophota bacterium]|nr:helix-hairpin-helix domain-containing protein [Candidatus Omnitrophota bacterium]HPS19437.1 helix-hairpin-helix domain-containing protein [Candidatus Omnitrophota bacterium]
MSMDIGKTEKAAIMILTILLFAGTVLFAVRLRATENRIEVIEGGISRMLSLIEVERILDEKRKINMNTASIADIELLPGVGPGLARRIVEYRELVGKFRSPEDLKSVKGIGEKKLEVIRPFLKFQ